MSETTLPRRKAILDQLAVFRLPPRIVAPPPRPAKPATTAMPVEVATPPPPEAPARVRKSRHHGKASRARYRLRRHRAARERLMEGLQRHEAAMTALQEVLMERYPAAFSEPPRPLKIGIDRDILADLACDAEILTLTMQQWTRHPDYRLALRAGGPRLGLDGSVQGEAAKADAARPAHMTERGGAPAGPC